MRKSIRKTVRRVSKCARQAVFARFLTLIPSVALPSSFQPFLPPVLSTFVFSTVPGNGDLNPYGVAFVPPGFPGGKLNPGDILVSNFNNSSNLQGMGTTILRVQLNPQPMFQQTSTFATTGKVTGLTAALGSSSKDSCSWARCQRPTGPRPRSPPGLCWSSTAAAMWSTRSRHRRSTALGFGGQFTPGKSRSDIRLKRARRNCLAPRLFVPLGRSNSSGWHHPDRVSLFASDGPRGNCDRSCWPGLRSGQRHLVRCRGSRRQDLCDIQRQYHNRSGNGKDRFRGYEPLARTDGSHVRSQ